jgi:hypothetical protein
MKVATDEQTDMNGPIMCSSLALKNKEQLKTDKEIDRNK